MKRLFLLIISFSLLAFTACSGDETSGDGADGGSGSDYNAQMTALLIGTWNINDFFLLGGEMTSYNLSITFNNDGTYNESLWWYWTADNSVVGNEDEVNSHTGYYSFNDDMLYLSGHISAFSESGEYEVYKLNSSEFWVSQFIMYQDTTFKFSK